jgi:hypothetical protein
LVEALATHDILRLSIALPSGDVGRSEDKAAKKQVDSGALTRALIVAPPWEKQL